MVQAVDRWDKLMFRAHQDHRSADIYCDLMQLPSKFYDYGCDFSVTEKKRAFPCTRGCCRAGRFLTSVGTAFVKPNDIGAQVGLKPDPIVGPGIIAMNADAARAEHSTVEA